MARQDSYPLSAKQVTDAIERFIPLINLESTKTKLLRIFLILLRVKNSPHFFNIAVKSLKYTETLIEGIAEKDGIDGVSDILNTPFMFELINDNDAEIVVKFLENYFTEENSLEKYLSLKFNLTVSNIYEILVLSLEDLLFKDLISERFNFNPDLKVTDKVLKEEIANHYIKKGYRILTEETDRHDGIIRGEKDEGDRILGTITNDPNLAIMVTISNAS
jgi:hypothetical protein